MSRFGLRAALRTLGDVLADVARLGLLTLQSRTQLAAENLFLRKQLALYIERQVKPRARGQRDTHRAGGLVASRRLASPPGHRQTRHADPMAPKRGPSVVAMEIEGARSSTDPSQPAAPDRGDDHGQSNMGRGTDRCGAPREAWDSCLAAHGSTLHAAAYDAASHDRVAGVEHLRAEPRTGRAGVRFLRCVTDTFRMVYVFGVLDVGTRRIRHWNRTEHPTAEWTAQQFRMIVAGDEAHRYVIHDRDSIYSEGWIARWRRWV
jgi:hypothetical protein